MSQWPSSKARQVLAALIRTGWHIKRQSARTRPLLARDGLIMSSRSTTLKRSVPTCLLVSLSTQDSSRKTCSAAERDAQQAREHGRLRASRWASSAHVAEWPQYAKCNRQAVWDSDTYIWSDEHAPL